VNSLRELPEGKTEGNRGCRGTRRAGAGALINQLHGNRGREAPRLVGHNSGKKKISEKGRCTTWRGC